jgi:hypothetical protein
LTPFALTPAGDRGQTSMLSLWRLSSVSLGDCGPEGNGQSVPNIDETAPWAERQAKVVRRSGPQPVRISSTAVAVESRAIRRPMSSSDAISSGAAVICRKDRLQHRCQARDHKAGQGDIVETHDRKVGGNGNAKVARGADCTDGLLSRSP